MNYCYRKGVQNSVPCWEVVPFSEGPLSEVCILILIEDSIMKHKSGEIKVYLSNRKKIPWERDN